MDIIEQVIREYLTKNAIAVKRDLDSAMNYDEDGDEVYYGPAYRQPTGKIIKNQWLFHGTSFKQALGILRDGFYGYDDLRMGLTFGCAHEGGSVAFAFPLDRSEDQDNRIVTYIMNKSDVLLVFQANGFEEYYEPDDKTEIIFDISSVHNMFLVFRFKLLFNTYGYTIPLKNGRFITFKDDKFLSSNKLYDWVQNNYFTYKNAIQTELYMKPEQYFNDMQDKAEEERRVELEKMIQSLPKKRKVPKGLKRYNGYREIAKRYRRNLYDKYNKFLDGQQIYNPRLRDRNKRFDIFNRKYYKNRRMLSYDDWLNGNDYDELMRIGHTD